MSDGDEGCGDGYDDDGDDGGGDGYDVDGDDMGWTKCTENAECKSEEKGLSV